MKQLFFTVLTAFLMTLCIGLPAHATTNRQAVVDVPLEPVRSMQTLGRIHSWRALDRDTLIIWATGLRPYLVELRWASSDLRFANVIGVTSFSGRVHSRFDSVLVDGFKYPIEQIYRLTPSDARALRAL